MKYGKTGRARIYAFIHNSSKGRQSGVTGLINLRRGDSSVFSEIAYPPFGYVMTLGTRPPHDGLTDISFFSIFGYKEVALVSLALPVLPVYTFIPGDYRDREAVARHLEQRQQNETE